jgi:hypothetical protein
MQSVDRRLNRLVFRRTSLRGGYRLLGAGPPTGGASSKAIDQLRDTLARLLSTISSGVHRIQVGSRIFCQQ